MVKYYQIDNMQFKLEQSGAIWHLDMYQNGEFFHRWGFPRYADALAEILSYAEIDKKDYDGEEDE